MEVRYIVRYKNDSREEKMASFEGFKTAMEYYDEKLERYGQLRVTLSIEQKITTEYRLL